MSKKSDKCTREMMDSLASCFRQPTSKISQCLKEVSKSHMACVSGVVSSDDGRSSLTNSLGASLYRKIDDRIYINSGVELPFNGNSTPELPFNGNSNGSKCYTNYITPSFTEKRVS